jgi:hypothetical protein
MPDYDVEVIGLAVPAASCPVAAYRPAVTVRNNGIYSAIINGTIRMYRRQPPGDLLATFPITMAALAAGASGIAQAATYWTPTVDDVGREFLFAADVTTDLDQLESNNHLSPVTVIVTAAEPPEPPSVQAHAPQHEHSGSDTLDLSDLTGHLATPQTPESHAYRHQAGGADILSVDGLPGTLLEAQPPTTHGNLAHSPEMASSLELENHADSSTAHADATNLANREVSGPELGLIPSAQVASGSAFPASIYHGLRVDRLWAPTKHASIGNTIPGNILVSSSSGLSTLISVLVPADWLTDDLQVIFKLSGLLHIHAEPAALLVLSSWIGSNQVTQIDFPVADAEDAYFRLSGAVLGKASSTVEGYLELHTQLPTPGTPKTGLDGGGFGAAYTPGTQALVSVKADLSSAHANTLLTVYSGLIRAINPIP